MSIIPDFPRFLHGGDYNPDQWLDTPEVIDDDFILMDKAHCNTFSVGIFSWGQIETAENHFDFSWLDDVFERAARGGKKIFLATPSAARPGWLAVNHPETGVVEPNGLRPFWSMRQTACLSSPLFRKKVRNIDRALAERYARHPALAGWHLSNEYSTDCHCPVCRAKFQDYLKRRYGTLKKLNRHYWSAFWSHTFTDWDQVNENDPYINIARIDWMRFLTELHAEFMKLEADAVREFSDAPLTTNMMGLNGHLNYWKIARLCDFISDDCYPFWRPSTVPSMASEFAFLHDLHYSMLKKPFLLMESCPGIPSYMPYVRMRRPNELEREMILAIGHGADGTMYFQWRKGRGNGEQLHGAVVGHDGTDKTLVFQNVARYGEKLERSTEILDSRRNAKVALLLDWESRWTLNFAHGFSYDRAKKSYETILLHYRALFEQNIETAVIDEEQSLDSYQVLILPMTYLFKSGFLAKLRAFTERGGLLVMTYLSAYTDESNRCFAGGNPAGPEGRALFGVWNEDIDGLLPESKQTLLWNGKSYEVVDFAEYLHAEGADVLGTYGSEFYAGSPALTVRHAGRGKAYYIACRTGLDFLKDFYGAVLAEAGIRPVLPNLPDGVHAVSRTADGSSWYFLVNLTEHPVPVSFPEPLRDLWNGGPVPLTKTILPPSGGGVFTDRQVPVAQTL